MREMRCQSDATAASELAATTLKLALEREAAAAEAELAHHVELLKDAEQQTRAYRSAVEQEAKHNVALRLDVQVWLRGWLAAWLSSSLPCATHNRCFADYSAITRAAAVTDRHGCA